MEQPMRNMLIPAVVLCGLVILGAAVAPQDQELERRVKQLEEQARKSEEQIANLNKTMERLAEWRDHVRDATRDLKTTAQRMESLGFTKAALSAESREELLRGMRRLADGLEPHWTWR